MVGFSLPEDPVPASVKIDLELHKPYRTWLGLGRLRCEWCHHKWGTRGCPRRQSAIKIQAAHARVRLYRAHWSAVQRRNAKDKVTVTWRHAARRAEVEQ